MLFGLDGVEVGLIIVFSDAVCGHFVGLPGGLCHWWLCGHFIRDHCGTR